MILAGIDIGTNTLRLLVAETGPTSFHERYSARIITRLGQDLVHTGKLSPEAIERSCKALQTFSASIQEHAAVHAVAIGTSALRNASNASAFIAEVNRITGLSIRVISGREEARLTLLGVAQALKNHDDPTNDALPSALTIDIGGGSTELILTQPDQEPLIESLPLGAVYLTERYIKHDPPLPDEILNLRESIIGTLDTLGPAMPTAVPALFVGTAGTITTLASMDQKLREYDPAAINGYSMSWEAVDRIVEALAKSTLQERRAMPGLETGREDIILAGAVVTQEIMKRFGFKTVLVSDWGLREGIVLDLYQKISTGYLT